MNANIKIALRVLYLEKQYALLNICGLALAIGCCLILGLYLRSELTYDQHNVLHERIYRVASELTVGDGETRFATTSQVLGPMLAESFSEVQAYTRLRRIDQDVTVFRHGDKAFYWSDVYFADANVFSVFTHKILYGNPEGALLDPTSIAVSETFARKYFGNANAVGETITNETNIPFKIEVVFADLPANTHVKYDMLVSFNSPVLNLPDDPNLRKLLLWFPSVYTYLLLPKNYDVARYRAISEDFFERNMRQPGRSEKWRSWLQPLDEIHLYSDVGADRPRGNRYYIYAFGAVAVFMMLIACINYVNLATARAAKRVRGVGLRKILGTPRAPLIFQFLAESVLFAIVAAVLGVVMVELALSLTPLPTLLGKPLRLDFWGEPSLIAVLLGFSVLIGVLAGAYPATHLSSWTPLSALVSSGRMSKRSTNFRKALVLVQLAISIAVIATTLLMAAQMRFISNMPLGFAKENRVIVTLRGADVVERLPTIMDELSNDPRVLGVTTSQTRFGRATLFDRADLEAPDGSVASALTSNMAVGQDFFAVMGMKLKQGRGFDKRLLTDVGTSFVVNETLVRTMNWDSPIGKRVKLGNATGTEGRVVGVVNDFNFSSLRTGIAPLLIHLSSEDVSQVPAMGKPFVTRLLILNIAGEGIAETLRKVQATIGQFDSVHPFEFEFLDDSLNDMYTSEENLMQLIGILAGICVLIACLGLYGLAAYTAEQRTREIGTRKVLGASPAQIVWLLAGALIPLVLVGAIAGSLLAYYAVDAWLGTFAYRARIDPLLFVVAAATAAIVAFATVALQSSGVARGDPVDALRYE